VQFIDDGGIVRLNLIANGMVLAVYRGRALILSEGSGTVAGSFEVWATGQRNDTSTLKDLAYRPGYRFLTTIGLVVERRVGPK
jgi:hypothetical protein